MSNAEADGGQSRQKRAGYRSYDYDTPPQHAAARRHAASEKENRTSGGRRRRQRFPEEGAAMGRSMVPIFAAVLGIFILAFICCLMAIRFDHLRNELVTSNEELTRAQERLEQMERQQEEQAEEERSAPEEETEEASAGMSDDIRRVYLTFDDGPSDVTAQILDILEQYQVKASFFVVGKEGERSGELYRRIAEEGHTLAMHSYSHDYDTLYASLESFQTDMHRLQNLLFDVTGVWATFYRFPGGSSNTTSRVPMEELTALLTREHITYFDWNVYGGDHVGTETIVQNVMANVGKYREAVILLHDGADKQETVEALPQIIEYLKGLEDTEILPITEDTVPVQHNIAANE